MIRYSKHTWKLQSSERQQTPNLWDRTTKFEEALTKLTKVVITNHKNTKAAIKSMKTQIKQLAKQFQTSSIGFFAATKENPKGHWKAIISTIGCDMGVEEEKRWKKAPC
ncbi:hypothetical protein HKD37_14G040826 [Glycine soja]